MNRRTRKSRKQETATPFPPVQDEILQVGPVVPQQTMHEVPPVVQEVLSSGGQPLDTDTQAFMESRFGHDFSQVRVHTDERAVESAQEVNALAYTVGKDVVFGEEQYVPGMLEGKKLLAHELTHTIQQSSAQEVTPTANSVQVSSPNDIYEREAHHVAEVMLTSSLPNLADKGQIRNVTPIMPTFSSIYSARLLQRDIPSSQPTPKTTARTSGKQIEEASYWFQEKRDLVFVESDLSRVSSKDVSFPVTVIVRFAYPESALRSKDIELAKDKILKAIAEIISAFGTYQYASKTERGEQLRIRARLKEAFKGFTTTKPLNIFIATIPTRREMTAPAVPETDQIYVDLKDIGNQSKMEAAIRLPVQYLLGGFSPSTGAKQQEASPNNLQKTMLHEALHTMLINHSADENTIWKGLKSSLVMQGPASVQEKGEELIRKYLLAQEEIFVYESTASIYPPVDKAKANYELFVKAVEDFFKRKGSTLPKTRINMNVDEKVVGKKVNWAITYMFPKSVALTGGDLQAIDLFLLLWPL